VSKQTILDLAPVSVSTEGHLGEVVQVQEFACHTLHAEVTEPVAADHGAEAGVVLGRCQDGLLFCLRIEENDDLDVTTEPNDTAAYLRRWQRRCRPCDTGADPTFPECPASERSSRNHTRPC
jgi:hypothetical protein